jgi:hypothetical protein
MTVTLNIPDALLASLGEGRSDVSRAVAEGFAIEAYRSGKLSLAEVCDLLGFSSRWQTEEFLSRHGAWPDPSESEVERDLENILATRVL